MTSEHILKIQCTEHQMLGTQSLKIGILVDGASRVGQPHETGVQLSLMQRRSE